MERRDFLKYMGAAGAVTVGSNWLVERLWAMVEGGELSDRLAEPPGLESWSPSICQLCPGGCGLNVRCIDGLPVSIQGNPLYPLNRGGVCAAGNAGLQLLYSPDRVRGPMKRVGAPGSTDWQPISWDEALEMLGNQLAVMRRAGHAHRAVFLDGGSRGLLSRIYQQFLTAYGSPNYIRTDDWDNRKSVFRFMQGYDDIPGVDMANARFVLSFGADLLEAESSQVWFSRQLTGLRDRTGQPRGRLVQIDPRMSATAVKADKWVPVKVGSEGALALGIAYMIIQEELYDKEFIEQSTFGFEDWIDESGIKHVGFKTLVLSDYYPEAVSRMTGVTIEDIVQLARKFAANRPAVAIGGAGVARQTNGFYAQLAIHALNALVGSIETLGGFQQRDGLPLSDWPEAKLDEAAKLSIGEPRIDWSQTKTFPLSTHLPANLAEHLLSEHPYPVEMLFLYKSNPVFELANGTAMKEALDKIPLVVSFSTFLDESSEFAHLILPDCHYLEGWQEDFGGPYVPFDYFGVSEPVIKPIADTKQTGDVVLTLAKNLGGIVAASLPFGDYAAAIKWAAERVFKSGRGVVIQNEFDEAWVTYLEERGWRYPHHATFEDFWKHLVEEGGWVEPASKRSSQKPVFATPSAKFEFYMTGLKNQFGKFAAQGARVKQTSEEFVLGSMINNLKIGARGDVLYLPHYEPPSFDGDEFDYPFYLVPYEINILGDGAGANAPMLMEMVGFRQYVRWNSWAEIHPATARDLKIADGDWIWIESPVSRLRVRARIFPGVQPEMVNLPVGLGHTALGQHAKNRGVNPHTILANDFDRLSGVPVKASTRVRMYKA